MFDQSIKDKIVVKYCILYYMLKLRMILILIC